MSESTHRLEWSADGCERIEAKIQRIENLAYNGIFAEECRASRFQQIGMEAKQLRQILREALLIVPVKGGGGDSPARAVTDVAEVARL